MPWGEPHATDPEALVGVALPGDLDTTRDMAWVFAEEFARFGFSAARIRTLFRSPFYAGAHDIWKKLGDAEIAAIVAECVAVWRAHRRPDAVEGAPGSARGGQA